MIRPRSGQVLVKAPLILILFLVFAALAVDTGFVHLRRATAQTASEAVALAAAQRASSSLLSTYGAVNLRSLESNAAFRAAMNNLASLNSPGCDAPVYEWGVWSVSSGFRAEPAAGSSELKSALRVTVRQTQPSFFRGLSRVVAGRATVVWTPYGDVWPMAVSSTSDFTPREVTFGPETTNNAPGSKGWLSFSGENNVPALEVYLAGGPYTSARPSPWTTSLALNQISSDAYTLLNGRTGAYIEIKGEPGLKHGVDDVLIAEVNAQIVVLIPIWDSVTGNGANTVYRIVGLVPIQLKSYTKSGGNYIITGRILSEGPIWFPANRNVAQALLERAKPALDLTMVE